MPLTLFQLVMMSSTLPKAEWGEVYSFVRHYTKYRHAFMRWEIAGQRLQNGDVYNWTRDDAHAWCKLMQAMEECHYGNGTTTTSLRLRCHVTGKIHAVKYLEHPKRRFPM